MHAHALRPLVLAAALLSYLAPPLAHAQQRPAIAAAPAGPGGTDPSLFRAPPLDPLLLVMGYHRLTGTGIDFRPYAERSTAYRNATAFDRADVLTREIARLEGQFASLDLSRTYVMRLGTQLRQYDGARGGYPLGLSPESFVPVNDPATYQQFGLQFRNSEEVAFLPVGDVTAARNFAQRYGLSTQYENAGDVVAEFAFRLAEAPPAVDGGTTIVRADIVAARVLTRTGQPMWDFGPTAAGRVPALQAAAPGAQPMLKAADVQGVRVGMPMAEGTGIASRAYPTGQGGRWFRNLKPDAASSSSNLGTDKQVRCGLDPLSLNDEMMRRQLGESTDTTVATASEACVGIDEDQKVTPGAAPMIARVTSGQLLEGTTVEVVRQALMEKYGSPTYTRGGGQVLRWIGRDPARVDGGLVSVTARIDTRREGGVLLGVEAVPYVDPNPRSAPVPASAPSAPRL